MNIHRHNYEEYFLLYIDNELTVDQKKQVELFVKQNPDLEEELLMLEQSKLIPDNSIHFNKKEMLMKGESDSSINMNNYQEWLVLYVDNELDNKEKIAVEKFAAAHPKVHQELELFQQTKLEPELVVFEHKEVLLRRERATIISIQWWRVAVAAILIVAAGITVYSILNSRNINGANSGNLANGKGQTKNRNAQDQRNPEPPLIDNDIKGTPDATSQEQKAAATQTQERKSKKQEGQNSASSMQQLATNETPRHPAVASPIDEIQAPEPQITNAVVASKTIHKGIFVDTTVTKPTLHTPDVYKTPEIDMPVAGGEYKKLRGFFRRTTRIIVRNTADNDNKLLIGGMAINVK